MAVLASEDPRFGGPLREKDWRVGDPGREVLGLDDGEAGETGSPDAASVSRNSTQRRENDCKGRPYELFSQVLYERNEPRSRLFSPTRRI
jgi:hypothetical protein